MRIINKQKQTILAIAVSLAIAPLIAADLIVSPGTTVNNSGMQIVTGGSVNASGSITGTGTVVVTDGSVNGTISNLTVQGKSSASGNLALSGTLTTEGDFDLNGKTVDLGATGTLNETTGRVYGDSGTIRATRDISAGTNSNIAGLGFSIAVESHMGITTIVRGHTVQTGSFGSSIQRFYDVSPTNNENLNATIIYSYGEEEVSGNEEKLRLFISWDEGVQWQGQGGELDEANNRLTLSGVQSFARWTAAENSLPMLMAVQNQKMLINTTLSLGLGMVTAVDPDGDALTLLVGEGDNYSVTGTTVIPSTDFTGTLRVPLRVSDGIEHSGELTMNIVVAHGNRAPILGSTSGLIIEKNKSLTVTIEMLNATDPDGDEMQVLIGSGEGYSVHGTTITPDEEFMGRLTVPIRVTDGIDTTSAEATVIRVVVKYIDEDWGHVTESHLRTTVDIQAGPNPLPPEASEMTFRADFGREGEAMIVQIFSATGDLVHRGTSRERSGDGWGVYRWRIDQDRWRLSGQSYLAIITVTRGGETLSQHRTMIGVTR